MAIVINLFGAPGAGKSTLAADIFSRLKRCQVKCELITEFAKDCVYEGNVCALMCQEYVFGNQSYRMFRCADKVDVIITDSPLPLSILYKSADYLDEDGNFVKATVPNAYKFEQFIFDSFKLFDNISILRGKREEDFAPVKNMVGEDSPETAKKLYENYWKNA